MNYLLTGAEFNNKGAESMTLVALNYIYENDSEANVFLFDYNLRPTFKLTKKLNFLYVPVWFIRKLCGIKHIGCYKSRIKDFIKFFIPWKKSAFGTFYKIKRQLRNINIMIDISGFAFSSKWGDTASIDWLSRIEMMQKFGAKVFVMPQSFGPFDFKSSYVLEYGKKVLEKCDLIYARELSGYELLRKMGLKNISRQSDSVLTSKSIDIRSLISEADNYIEQSFNFSMINGKNIAIIPNTRLTDKGGVDISILLRFYTDIINKYVENFNFYLVAHAGEDLVLCKLIKEKYLQDDRVILVPNVLSSFVYETMISKMCFIIASRYHAIVHAYKESIPAVVLGWADKYQGLLEDVNQLNYLINLNVENEAEFIVSKMVNEYKYESKQIKEKMDVLQTKSCYDFLKLNK